MCFYVRHRVHQYLQSSQDRQQALNGKLNIQSIIGNKSTAWEKENELRITFEDWGLLTYNHTAVKSIIFGAKARKEDIKNTMNLLKGRGLKYKQIEISSKNTS